MLHVKLIKLLGKSLFLFYYYLIIALLLSKTLLTKVWNIIRWQKNSKVWHPLQSIHPDVFTTSHAFLQHQQFSFDQYQILTPDNAYITLWRIRHKNPSKWNNQNPILILHGLLDCAMSWFLHQDKMECLPYVLANQGYDVWVGNNRGTHHSDRNKEQQQYWEFCIDHFVMYDQPAFIHHVLTQTSKQKLIYIGHSQGSTQFLLAQGEFPQLQQKISKFIGMGTVLSLKNIKQHKLLNALSKFYLIQILDFIGFKTLLDLPLWMKIRSGVLLLNFTFMTNLVEMLIATLCGSTQSKNIDFERIGILASHEPGGTSICTIKHWIQTVRRGTMHKYDYGCNQNLKKYSSTNPPQYPLLHLKLLPYESFLFRGEKDLMISNEDFQSLLQKFNPNKIESIVIGDYAHLDYAWGAKAKQHVYDRILHIIKRDNDGIKNGESTDDVSSIQSQLLNDNQ